MGGYIKEDIKAIKKDIKALMDDREVSKSEASGSQESGGKQNIDKVPVTSKEGASIDEDKKARKKVDGSADDHNSADENEQGYIKENIKDIKKDIKALMEDREGSKSEASGSQESGSKNISVTSKEASSIDVDINVITNMDGSADDHNLSDENEQGDIKEDITAIKKDIKALMEDRERSKSEASGSQESGSNK